MIHTQVYPSTNSRLAAKYHKSVGRKPTLLLLLDVAIIIALIYFSIEVYLTRAILCEKLDKLEKMRRSERSASMFVQPTAPPLKRTQQVATTLYTKRVVVPNDHTEMERNDYALYDYQIDPDMTNLFPTRKPIDPSEPTLSPRMQLKALNDARLAKIKEGLNNKLKKEYQIMDYQGDPDMSHIPTKKPTSLDEPTLSPRMQLKKLNDERLEKLKKQEENFEIQKDPDMSEIHLTRSMTKTPSPMPTNQFWSSLLERQRLHNKKIEYCPDKQELFNFDNSQCKPIWKSKFPNSPILPIYKPWHPGPSEQTYGIKDVIIAATMVHRGLVIHPFTIHQSDKQSTNAFVPMGLRIDLNKLCNYIELVHPLKKLNQLIIINEKRKHFNKDIVNALKYLEIYMPDVEFDPDWKVSNKSVKMIPGLKCNHFPQEEEQDFIGYWNKLNMDDNSMIGVAHPYKKL